MVEEDRILKINIENEMKSAYIDYSMSVIVSRALPDVRDGMKPVHRRVLFGMNEMGNTSSHPHKKSANCVGEVMGKYHPHGDSSIYGTVVRMAQDWSLRYCLVDGHGNFGSVDGDGAAAMRYTEVRLSKIGEEMLADIDKETVDFQPNYDNSRQEPTVLPTRIPNLLVNGASGIAVGMATNIPLTTSPRASTPPWPSSTTPTCRWPSSWNISRPRLPHRRNNLWLSRRERRSRQAAAESSSAPKPR